MRDKARAAARKKVYEQENRETIAAKRKAYYLANREKIAIRMKAWRLAARLANPEGKREAGRVWVLRKREDEAGRKRPNACEVCGGAPGKHSLHFDHDHTTGEFRGFLCHGCNLALGNVRDSAARLRALATYLEQHEKSNIRELRLAA